MAREANYDLVYREHGQRPCSQCDYSTCLRCKGCNQPICVKRCDSIHIDCPAVDDFDDDGSMEN